MPEFSVPSFFFMRARAAAAASSVKTVLALTAGAAAVFGTFVVSLVGAVAPASSAVMNSGRSSLRPTCMPWRVGRNVTGSKWRAPPCEYHRTPRSSWRTITPSARRPTMPAACWSGSAAGVAPCDASALGNSLTSAMRRSIGASRRIALTVGAPAPTAASHWWCPSST